jgi:hypothetical protein
MDPALRLCEQRAGIRSHDVIFIDRSPIWSASRGPQANAVLVLSAAATNVNHVTVIAGATRGLHLRLACMALTVGNDVPFLRCVSSSARNATLAARPPTGLLDLARVLLVIAIYGMACVGKVLNNKPGAGMTRPSRALPKLALEPQDVRHAT